MMISIYATTARNKEHKKDRHSPKIMPFSPPLARKKTHDDGGMMCSGCLVSPSQLISRASDILCETRRRFHPDEFFTTRK